MGGVLVPISHAVATTGRRPLRRGAGAVATLVTAVAAAALLVVPAAAPAAADDPTVGVGAAPATSGALDERTAFSYVVTPGQQQSDELLVRNTGSVDAQVEVYAADASNTADGAFAVADAGVTPTGAASWVAFAGGARTQTLSLAAGAQELVPFTLTVPTGAAPGDHPAAVVAATTTVSGQVTVDRRVATRLYARVQGAVTPVLAVTSTSAAQAVGGGPFAAPTTITAVIANTGDVALTAHLEAGVRTWFGARTGTTVAQDLPELLPGATRTVSLTIDGVGRFGYLAPFVTLTPAADAGAYDFAGTLEPVHGRTTTAGIPWLLLGVVLVAVLAVWLPVRRRRVGAAGDGDVEGGAADDDAGPDDDAGSDDDAASGPSRDAEARR
jgi:dihydroorotate dehydrogenase (fumarate)